MAAEEIPLDSEGYKRRSDVLPGQDQVDPLLNDVEAPPTSQATTMDVISESKPGIADRLHPKSLCPEPSKMLRYATLLLMLGMIWLVLFTIFRETVLPHSPLFALVGLFLLAYIAGWLVSLIKLPPLLGMLVTGIAIRQAGIFNMSGGYVTAVSTLRLVAMVVILIKAGLGLDAGALRRLSLVVVRLAFTPCLIETAVDAVMAHFVLGFPWLWGILLGFILSAVSPAVVVPSLLALQEKGYGEDKGISTLVIAASSIDDIAAISGFGVVLGIIFSQGELFQQVIHGPVEVLIGLSFGLTWGTILVYLPHREDRWVVCARSVLVGAGGLFAVFGSSLVGYSGAGPLASIVAAFVACYGWKKLGWSSAHNPVANIYSVIWTVFQPVLFGLIGTEIDLHQLHLDTVLYGLCVLGVGLVFRILASLVATLGGTLNAKEMMFVAIAWFPKATVQAALGPVALDIARQNKADSSVEHLASQVLTIAVLSILVTAPIGAVGIYLAGPRLLNRVLP